MMPKLLTEAEQLKSPMRYLSRNGRKCDDWDEAPQCERGISHDEWCSLVHVHQTVSSGHINFCDPFACDAYESFGMLFILHLLNGKIYLVNTEGSRYCRYICEVKVPVCPFNNPVPDFAEELDLFMGEVFNQHNSIALLRAALEHMTSEECHEFIVKMS